MNPPNEFYVWGAFSSTRNFDRNVWSNYEVATYAGRWIWRERAKCLLCGKLVGWSGCAGNLKLHLKRNHSDLTPRSEETFPVERGKPIKMFGKWLIDGNSVRSRQHETWNYFYQECLPDGRRIGYRYVTCIICGRDMYWNGKGLGKLKAHLQKIHDLDLTPFL